MKIYQAIAVCALCTCAVVGTTSAARSQAYVDQLSPGIGGAYVTQTPPTAQPVPATNGRASTLVQRDRKGTKPKPTAYRPFPTVGRGSSAVVGLSADKADWPTVGRGAVNR